MQDGVPEHPLDPVAVKTAEKSLLSPRNERRMKELLEALCDPTRVKIVRALRETTLAAGDLAHVINRSRSATSQHLKVLPRHRRRGPGARGERRPLHALGPDERTGHRAGRRRIRSDAADWRRRG